MTSVLVNETSRLSQLTPAGITKLSATMVDNNLMFSAIEAEIRSTIDNMNANLFFDSLNWYSEANSFAKILSVTYGVTPEIAAGVISAVSPRMPWLRNKSIAEDILASFRYFDESLSAMAIAQQMRLGLFSNIAMAVKIARGEDISNVLTGTKRRSFYNNIIEPTMGDSVTVDTWMARSIMNTTNVTLKVASDLLRANRIALGGTGVGYYVIAEATRNVATDMGILPHEVQAAYWCAVSDSINGGREDIS